MEFICSEVFMEKVSGWVYRNVLLLLPLLFQSIGLDIPLFALGFILSEEIGFYLFNAKSPSSPANEVKLIT